MSLEAAIVILDNSAYSINGDYVPTRLEAQVDSMHVIFNYKTRAHPESEVGLMLMAGKAPEVLATPTRDEGKLVAALHERTPGGETDLLTAIQVAQLALKHRQRKEMRQRIIVFVASPLPTVTAADLTKLGKRLKKNNISVDIVSFGSDDTVSAENEDAEGNEQKLRALYEAVNAADSSHYLRVEPGPGLLSDRIAQSPILSSADGEDGEDVDIDPNLDPELAMALRMSLEEERARQAAAAAAGPSTGDTLETVPEEGPVLEDIDMDDPELAQALALSRAEAHHDEPQEEDVEMADAGEDAGDDEDADIALAIALSMQEQEQNEKEEKDK